MSKRVTDLTAIEEQLGSGDLFMVVDKNDTSSGADGTSKKFDTKYLMQTDKISVSNADLHAMKADGSAGSFKTLVGALSGYMITVYSVNVLCTYAASTESSSENLYLGYKSDTTSAYWTQVRDMMNGKTDDLSFTFTGAFTASGSCSESLLNKPFLMYASAPFDGGWSCDVYVTYAYTKVL